MGKKSKMALKVLLSATMLFFLTNGFLVSAKERSSSDSNESVTNKKNKVNSKKNSNKKKVTNTNKKNSNVNTSENMPKGIYHYTRYDMENMLKHKNDAQYQMPDFNSSDIKDIPEAKDNFDNDHIGEALDVWDSWPVKDSTGNVADIHGYRVVFALVGNPNPSIPNKENGQIGVFYQKNSDGNGDISTWHYAGLLFNSNLEGADNKSDATLAHETGEWSGSAMLQSDGNIRLMYTSFSGSKDFGGYGDNKQTLMTAQVSLDLNGDGNGLFVDHDKATGRKAIFEGDNKYYEDVEHSTDVTGFNHDDHTLRDPQIFIANGSTYVLFEGNTSQNDGPSGINSLNNMIYYGGSKKFQQEQKNLINSNPQLATYDGDTEGLKQSAADDNGCLGLIKLDNNYNVSEVLPPLVTFNLVDDETERPSIVYANNRWYIFTAMHGWHMASPNAGTNDSFMLGFSSTDLTKNYTPLNKYGLVMHTDQNIKSRTYTYSYSMNQQPDQPYLLTSYINQLATPEAGGHSTFAPTIKIWLNGTSTKMDPNPLKQGQLNN